MISSTELSVLLHRNLLFFGSQDPKLDLDLEIKHDLDRNNYLTKIYDMLKETFLCHTECIQGQSANIGLKCLFSSHCFFKLDVKDLAQPLGSFKFSIPIMLMVAII